MCAAHAEAMSTNEQQMSAEDQAMMIGEQHAAERLMASQKIEPGSPYLAGEAAPTRQQVAAVLHALADHTMLSHLNSEQVLALGDDRAHLGGTWRAATAQGRFLQRMGNRLGA